MQKAFDKDLYSNVIRLHILAQSDSDEDQMAKLSVRDGVSEYIYSLVSSAQNKEQAEKIIAGNLSLIEENTRLKARVLMLETVLSSSLQVDSVGVFKKDYSFLSAKAVYNTIDNIQNYIVIDRGTEDGVSPEMGVIDGDGVVGIVKTTSKHFSLVLPILNVQSRLSCRVNRGGCFGSLVWDAKDARYAMLEEIPRHVKVEVGDSIFTSGLSSVFPEGFLVGVVDDSFLNEDAANHTIKVRLACDFYSVNYVKVVRYDKKEEYDTIKTEI
jgi:rod shape-determining protein MreC